MSDKKDFKVIPMVKSIIDQKISGAMIEDRSLAIIDKEAPAHNYDESQWRVVRRMIHASADMSLVGAVSFSSDAIEKAVKALKAGVGIYVDSRMINAGLSRARLEKVNQSYSSGGVYCHIADKDISEKASASGLPRSLYAVRKAKDVLDGGIAVFGNAPVALLELNRMVIEEGIRPSVVIGMPVGFVHVLESKDELSSLDIPYITVSGRRGGSPLAVSALHALCGIAAESAL